MFRISFLMLFCLVGCASVGDTDSLKEETTVLRLQNIKQHNQIQQLIANQEALKGDLSDLSWKMDMLFFKHNQK